MIHNEPVIVSVTMELSCDCVLEPVDDPPVLSPPAWQTTLQRMMTKNMNSLT